MIVLDASAAVDFALGTDKTAGIGRRLQEALEIHMPELLIVEANSAVARLLRSNELTSHRARVTMESIQDIRAVRHRHDSLAPRALELTGRCSAYAAFYVALAEGLGATLLTADARLARAAESLVGVELVS